MTFEDLDEDQQDELIEMFVHAQDYDDYVRIVNYILGISK